MKFVSVIHPIEKNGTQCNDNPSNSCAQPRAEDASEVNDVERELFGNFRNNISEKAWNENQKIYERQYKQEVRLIA